MGLIDHLLREVFVPGCVCLFDLIDISRPFLQCLSEDGFFDLEQATTRIRSFDDASYRWLTREYMPTQNLFDLVECVVCLDEAHNYKMVPVPCGHHFCIACLHEGWLEALKIMEPYTCCLRRIPTTLIAGSFDVESESMRDYIRLLRERDTLHPFFCSSPKCSELIGSFDQKALKRGSIRSRGIQCSACKTFTCVKCRTPAHWGAPCIVEGELRELFTQVDIRRCPKCHNGIEKNGGCDHMHCRACNSHWWWMQDGSMKPYRL